MVAPGTVLGGRFEIVEELGRGGHGVVYRGRQRPLGRDVAIKILLAEASTPAMTSRFAREVGLVQRLEHPNTVRLYDFGTTEEGTPFIVFELLRGRGLDAELAASPLSPVRIAKIAVQVLKALSEAHALGIIHRDIKPANVLLVDYAGERDFVKLLDFGVARSMLPSSRESVITHDGQLIGTPAYMAPEQVRDEPLSAGTDLYALGLVIAEALTGRPVFEGADVTVCLAHASSAPVPLPDEVTASPLGAVITRATEKDPAKRYASADAMIADLERVLAKGAAREWSAAPETRRADSVGVAATDPLAAPIERAPQTERLIPMQRPQTVPLSPTAPATAPPRPTAPSRPSHPSHPPGPAAALAGAARISGAPRSSMSGPPASASTLVPSAPPSGPDTARRGASAYPPGHAAAPGAGRRPRIPGTWETLGVVALFALAGLGLWQVFATLRPAPTIEIGPVGRHAELSERLRPLGCRIVSGGKGETAYPSEAYILEDCGSGTLFIIEAPDEDAAEELVRRGTFTARRGRLAFYAPFREPRQSSNVIRAMTR